jgi:hypothetical protein
MATLDIFLSEPVHANQLEKTIVTIDGAPGSKEVVVKLAQIQGKKPFWGPETKKVTTDATGSGFATFDVRFEGPTPSATLQATATDSAGTSYSPDAHSIEVLP